jgi:hypothetical protein
MVLTHLLTEHVHFGQALESGRVLLILIACLVGIIPESGPHLIFVTLFAKGTLPFSVLLANSIVQDGHGMLPLLAHSRRTFFTVKAVNLIAGVVVGLLLVLIETW